LSFFNSDYRNRNASHLLIPFNQKNIMFVKIYQPPNQSSTLLKLEKVLLKTTSKTHREQGRNAMRKKNHVLDVPLLCHFFFERPLLCYFSDDL